MDGASSNALKQPLWRHLVLDKSFLSKIDQLVLKRFGDAAIAEECASYILSALSEDNWRRCNKYQGLSKPTTFLYTIVLNLIEEYSRSQFGRPRPPVWVSKQGELWVLLWRSLCLERQLIPTILDRFSTKGFNVEQVEHAIKVIKARIPNCGQGPTRCVSTDTLEDVEAVCGVDDSNAQQESLLFERHSGAVLYSILQSILADEATITRLGPELGTTVHSLTKDQQQQLLCVRKSLKLTDTEKILIRMVYVDGVSKSKAARALNLPTHQGGKIINATLSRIREIFELNGFDLETFLKQLN